MPKCSLVLALVAALPLVQAAEFQVAVGGLQFSPPSVNASAGDVVTFVFQQGNNTATQSTLQSPCEMAPGGFDSGFIFVSASNIDGPFPAAQYNVTSADPIWVYSRQADNCEHGMVFAINPGDQFPAFIAGATGGTLSPSAAPPSPSASLSQESSLSAPSSSQAPATQSNVPATPPATISAPLSPSETIYPSVTSSSILPSEQSSAASAAPTVSLSSDHVVVVGGPDNVLAFSPSNITAQAGDTITFQFRQSNHSVTQSTFSQPCVALTEVSTSGQVGFDSGFVYVADNATSFPTFTLQVNDTSPVWAFSKQADECLQGMVFSINAPLLGPDSFAEFKDRAKASNVTSMPNITSTSVAAARFPAIWSAEHFACAAVTVFALLLGFPI